MNLRRYENYNIPVCELDTQELGSESKQFVYALSQIDNFTCGGGLLEEGAGLVSVSEQIWPLTPSIGTDFERASDFFLQSGFRWR
jgi:hypothetical protein